MTKVRTTVNPFSFSSWATMVACNGCIFSHHPFPDISWPKRCCSPLILTSKTHLPSHLCLFSSLPQMKTSLSSFHALVCPAIVAKDISIIRNRWVSSPGAFVPSHSLLSYITIVFPSVLLNSVFCWPYWIQPGWSLCCLMWASALDALLWWSRWSHCSHERAMVQHKTEEYLEEAQFNHQYLQDNG